MQSPAIQIEHAERSEIDRPVRKDRSDCIAYAVAHDFSASLDSAHSNACLQKRTWRGGRIELLRCQNSRLGSEKANDENLSPKSSVFSKLVSRLKEWKLTLTDTETVSFLFTTNPHARTFPEACWFAVHWQTRGRPKFIVAGVKVYLGHNFSRKANWSCYSGGKQRLHVERPFLTAHFGQTSMSRRTYSSTV